MVVWDVLARSFYSIILIIAGDKNMKNTFQGSKANFVEK